MLCKATVAARPVLPKVRGDRPRKLSRVLSFGRRSQPRCLVVMLHGLSDSAEWCAGHAAEAWAKAIEGSLVLVPQAPDRSLWGEPEPEGYDWLQQRGRQDTSDAEANVRELQRLARSRAAQLQGWLLRLLRRHGLGRERLVLVGFSQGSILATLCAARLGALGAVVCGGLPSLPIYSARERGFVGDGWMRWEELLPRQPLCTRFCAINGTKDPYVARQQVEQMLAPFDCHWHWDRGVGHDFPDRWYKVALKWMKNVLEQPA